MTIFLGSTSFDEQNDKLVIKPPFGFNTIQGVRIANYTVDVLILQNITGDNLSDRQYLPPATQMFYPIRNAQDYPTMDGLQIGPDLPNEQVLIEWSDDPDNDFLGTYPYALPLNPDSFASGNQAYNVRYEGNATPDDGLHYSGGGAGTPTVDASSLDMNALPARLAATIVNEGTNDLYYSKDGGFGVGAYTTIVPGASLTIGNGSHVTIHAENGMDDAGTILSIFGEASIA